MKIAYAYYLFPLFLFYLYLSNRYFNNLLFVFDLPLIIPTLLIVFPRVLCSYYFNIHFIWYNLWFHLLPNSLSMNRKSIQHFINFPY